MVWVTEPASSVPMTPVATIRTNATVGHTHIRRCRSAANTVPPIATIAATPTPLQVTR